MFMNLWQVWLVAQLQGRGKAVGSGDSAREGWQIQPISITLTTSSPFQQPGGRGGAVQSPLGEPQLKNCRITLESEHVKTQDVDTTPGAVGSFATVCLAAVCSIWSLLSGFKVRKILWNNGETWWEMSISGLFSNWSNCEIAGGRFLGYSKVP